MYLVTIETGKRGDSCCVGLAGDAQQQLVMSMGVKERLEWVGGKRGRDPFDFVRIMDPRCLFLKLFERMTQSRPTVKLESPRGHTKNIVPPLIPVQLLLLNLNSLSIRHVCALEICHFVRRCD